MSKSAMKLRNIYAPNDLWQQAKKKSGKYSLAAIIRVLICKWVKGEIILTSEEIESEAK